MAVRYMEFIHKYFTTHVFQCMQLIHKYVTFHVFQCMEDVIQVFVDNELCTSMHVDVMAESWTKCVIETGLLRQAMCITPVH